MIGPHYQKIAQVQHKLNARQLLQRIHSRSHHNPLTQIVDKLRRQFTTYSTAYTPQLIDHQIHSVDRLLSFDGKLGPILSGLQKENNLLRKQLQVLQNQLSNTVAICEQILGENGELKQVIRNKNVDLQKIVDTIALNQSEQRGALQDKISLLEQENSILIRHLQEIRNQHKSYNQKFIMQKQQTQSWRTKFQQTKKHLTHIHQQQQQLSRKLSLIEHNLYNQTQRVYNLQAQLQVVRFENNQMRNQLMMYKSSQVTNSIQVLKAKLEQQYAGILEENRRLKKERGELLRQVEVGKMEKEQAGERVGRMEAGVGKLQRDLELTQNLLAEHKQKNAALQSSISRMEVRFDQLKAENNKLRLQVESTNNYAINKERVLNREIEQLREELDKKSNDMERGLKDLREKTRVLMETKQGELKSLNDTNIELRKLLERQQYHHDS